MIPRTAGMLKKPVSQIDSRIWWMLAAVAFFAILVMKEISLPPPIILACGILGLAALLAIGIHDPSMPVYMLVAYLPFSRLLVGDFGTTATALNFTNFLIAWIIIAHVFNRAARRDAVTTGTPLNKLIALFCILGSISLARGAWQYGSWYLLRFVIPLKQWLTATLCYFLILWVVRDKRTMKTIVVLIMVCVVVVALMAIRDYLNVGDTSFERSRIGGIAEQPNTLGAFFNYYMFLLMGFFLMHYKKPKAWLLWIPFMLCFRGIMVTFSRGAYLGFAAGMMALAFFRSKGLLLFAIIFSIFLILTPGVLPPGIRYRMGMTMAHPQEEVLSEGSLTEGLDTSAARRIDIWKGAVRMIHDHPWSGVGYGAFPGMISQYTDINVGVRDAHNSYLLIGAEMGLPTLILFLLILCVAGYYTFWLYRHTQDPFFKATALGMLGGLSALLVANMFGSRMDDQAVASYFWILCAIIMRAVLIERHEHGLARVKPSTTARVVVRGTRRRRSSPSARARMRSHPWRDGND